MNTLDKKIISILAQIKDNTADLATTMSDFDPMRSPGGRMRTSSPLVYASGRVPAKRTHTAPAMAQGPRISTPYRAGTIKQATPLPLEPALAPPAPYQPAERKTRAAAMGSPARRTPARDARGRFVKTAQASTGSSTVEKVVEARAKNQEKAQNNRFGKMVTGSIRSGFGAAGSVMGVSGQNGEKGDIVGTAAGGPMWSAARELIDAAGTTKDNRFANAILARFAKKDDAVPETSDGRRDEQGRFIAGAPVAAGGGGSEPIEIAEQNLESVKDIGDAIEDSDSNADRRNRQLIKAIIASGTGSGGSTGGGILDWLFHDKSDKTKGPKKGPGKIKKALSSGLSFAKKAGGKALGGIGSFLGFGKDRVGTAAKAGGGALKNVLSFGKTAGGTVLNGARSILGLGGLGSAGVAASGTTAATGGGLMATIGSALAPVAGVLGSGAAGYGAGTLINKGLGKATGGGEGWLGNWLYDKLHPKAEAPERYPVKKPENRTVKELRPAKPESQKPQVIIQQVPAPAVKETKHPDVVRREKERAAGGYHIPTQFDDTLLMLMALDKI